MRVRPPSVFQEAEPSMTFTVIYRNASGGRATFTLDAPDRAAVWKELGRRGVRAVSVTAGDGPAHGRRPFRGRGVWAGVLAAVLVGGTVGVFCVWTGGHGPAAAAPASPVATAPSPARAAAGRRVALRPSERGTPPCSVRVNAAPAAEASVRKPARRLWNGIEVVASSGAETNRDGAVVERLLLADGRRVRTVSLPAPVFRHPSDQLLAMALSAESGGALPPLPLGPDVERDFLRSLETPEETLPTDSAETRELKRRVAEAREAVAAEVRAGRSVREVLEAFQKERANELPGTEDGAVEDGEADGSQEEGDGNGTEEDDGM